MLISIVTARVLNEGFRDEFLYWYWYYPFTTTGGAVT